MHALGNDFILFDATLVTHQKLLHFFRKKPQIVQKLCSRRTGIGADQVLLLCNSKKVDFSMRIFNSDGSEVEMCGNGIRCLGKYIWDNKLKIQNSKFKTKNSKNSKQKHLSIETPAGIIHLHKSGNLIRVNMGEPILEPEKIPVKIDSKFKIQNSKMLKIRLLL
jgi:diaminopimelate epimerase